MSENTDLETTIKKLPGIIMPEQFKTIVDREIELYYKEGRIFSIFVLEFKIVDEENCPFPQNVFMEYIGKVINNFTRENKDCYTIGPTGIFKILFSETPSSLAYVLFNKIINDVKQKLGNFIQVNQGLAECPQDGATYRELVDTANKYLLKLKDKKATTFGITKSIAPIQQQELEKSLSNIERHVKSQLFKELNKMMTDITKYDVYLGEHSALVTKGSVMLAQELSLPWPEIEEIAIAALLHDIGYTLIPKEIFQKPGKLSQDEWKIIKMHPWIASEQILKPINIFHEYIPIILNHHEFLDGSGYPRGLKGDQIPIGAQILSIIDSYQAMRVDRPYRKALMLEDIIDVYIKNAGIKWEERLITIFTAMVADPATREKLSDKKKFNLNFLSR